jgi:hypothetical protein
MGEITSHAQPSKKSGACKKSGGIMPPLLSSIRLLSRFAAIGSAGAFAFAIVLAISALALTGILASASMLFFCSFGLGGSILSLSNGYSSETNGQKASESSSSKFLRSRHGNLLIDFLN